MEEIVSARARTAKFYHKPDGGNTALIHGKSLHYEEVEGSGEWLNIDPAIQASDREGYAYEAVHNRFKFYFKADYSDDWPALVTLYEHNLSHGLKAVCHLDKDTKEVTILQLAQSSQAEVNGPTVRYNNVFNGVDVEYIVDHDYCKENIHISEAAKATLRQTIIDQELSTDGYLVFATKLDLAGSTLNLDLAENTEREGRITWKDVAQEAKHFFPLGRTEDEGGNRQNVRYRLINHPTHGWLLLSGIPLTWLADSVGAVVVDPTDYYAETTDGYIVGINAVYATAHSTATGYDTSSINMTVGQRWLDPNYLIYRLVLEFDTSAIPDDATINQSNLYLKTEAVGDAGPNFDVEIVKVNWASPISDANKEASYDACIAAAKDQTWRTTVGIADETYYASPNLDTSRVNKTGMTQYGLVSSRDVNEDVPTGDEFINLYSADQAGTASDPYLRVDYTVPGLPGSGMLRGLVGA